MEKLGQWAEVEPGNPLAQSRMAYWMPQVNPQLSEVVKDEQWGIHEMTRKEQEL